MVCAGNYLPKFQDQINADDPLGGSNCTTYSAAMAADYDTCGKKVPTGRGVRALCENPDGSPDRIGGTTLLQVDKALQDGWGVNLDVRIGSSKMTWAAFAKKINAGYGAILQGSYSVIHGTKYSGDPNFTGNHAMFIPPGWGAMDPLCDGRRAGIYEYHGEAYPQDLLKKFAGALVLDSAKGNKLGLGYVWCALTRDNTVIYRVSIAPKTGAKSKSFRKYTVKNGKITGFKLVTTTTAIVGNSTAPKTYPAVKGLKYKSKRLVKITTGSHAGWYVNAVYVKETK